jgi:hypothetical protein
MSVNIEHKVVWLIQITFYILGLETTQGTTQLTLEHPPT